MKNMMMTIPLAAGFAVALMCAGCGLNTVDGCLNKAAECAVNKDWPGALKLAGRAVSLDPQSIAALLFQAVAYEKTGSRDLALNAARQAVSIDPNSFAAQYTLGRLYAVEPARATDAMRALLRAKQLRPDDVNTLVLLCNIAAALRSPQLPAYLAELKRCDPAVESSAAYLTQLGIGQIGRREYEAAKQSFLGACRSSANQPDTVFNMGTFMERYTSSGGNARAFYQLFLKQTSGQPEYAARRAEAENRLSRLNRR